MDVHLNPTPLGVGFSFGLGHCAVQLLECFGSGYSVMGVSPVSDAFEEPVLVYG